MRAVPFKVRAASALSIFTMLSLAVPFVSVPQAHAGIRICKFNYTGSKDRARLGAALQRALPSGVSAEGVTYICRNRGEASAWRDTWAHLRPDGVTEWWTTRCERKRREWRCEASVRRQLIWAYAEVGGIQRRLEVSFDEATSLAQARRSAVLAHRLIQDASSAPVPACGLSSSADWQREWEKVRRDYALTPQDAVAELTVEFQKPGVMRVTTGWGGGFGLTITDGSSGLPAEGPACWREWIVIG